MDLKEALEREDNIESAIDSQRADVGDHPEVIADVEAWRIILAAAKKQLESSGSANCVICSRCRLHCECEQFDLLSTCSKCELAKQTCIDRCYVDGEETFLCVSCYQRLEGEEKKAAETEDREAAPFMCDDTAPGGTTCSSCGKTCDCKRCKHYVSRSIRKVYGAQQTTSRYLYVANVQRACQIKAFVDGIEAHWVVKGEYVQVLTPFEDRGQEIDFEIHTWWKY